MIRKLSRQRDSQKFRNLRTLACFCVGAVLAANRAENKGYLILHQIARQWFRVENCDF